MNIDKNVSFHISKLEPKITSNPNHIFWISMINESKMIMNPSKNKNVLDFGCGDGGLLKIFTEMDNLKNGLGLELDEKLVKRAKLNNSEKLIKFVNNGYQSAQNSALLMDAINEKTKSIEDAIVIIDQIAFQTNILSLNAAVEAATAGEAGRGFAVVAQEVRNLASRAAEAAKEIKQLVGSATNETNKGKIASSEMIREYDILNENIINTKSLMEDISSSLKEQQKGIEQINRAISQIDFATQENASSAQDTMKIAIQNDNMANTMVIETNKTNFFGRDEYNNLLKQKI